MDLRRLIKGVIMGLLEKSKQTKEIKAEKLGLRFTKPELEFMLKLIASSTFQGRDIQLIYDIISKLQKQYTK
jgi:hypothetical protein